MNDETQNLEIEDGGEDESRDYYAEGADAALAGNSDLPPEDVSAAGLEAEALWNDGYASVTGAEGVEGGNYEPNDDDGEES